MQRLTIEVRPEEYAVARLEPHADVPAHLLAPADGALVSVTRTDAELSVVCPAPIVPDTARSERGWRVLTVRRPPAFTQAGVIAAVSSELAAAGVTLFSLSTFDTDHMLVTVTYLGRAVTALRAAGHEIHGA